MMLLTRTSAFLKVELDNPSHWIQYVVTILILFFQKILPILFIIILQLKKYILPVGYEMHIQFNIISNRPIEPRLEYVMGMAVESEPLVNLLA